MENTFLDFFICIENFIKFMTNVYKCLFNTYVIVFVFPHLNILHQGVMIHGAPECKLEII